MSDSDRTSCRPSTPHAPTPRALGGRYRPEALLAEGGMSTIDRAVDLQCERIVAIKRLRPEFATQPDALARLTREARILDRLQHPNCLRLLDCGQDESGTPYLVLPLLVGQDLRTALRGPLPLHQAIELGLQLLDGLIHIHDQGFIHRDIKLENLVITRSERMEERLVIVDFGVAGLPANSPMGDGLQTAVGTQIGTPGVMSPEQILGDRIDMRSDLYATGAVLYELLSGTAPFHAPDVVSTLQLQVLGHAPPLPPAIPEGISEWVQHMMEVSPDDRPASARQARDALARRWAVLGRGRRSTTHDLLGPRYAAASTFGTQILPPSA